MRISPKTERRDGCVGVGDSAVITPFSSKAPASLAFIQTSHISGNSETKTPCVSRPNIY